MKQSTLLTLLIGLATYNANAGQQINGTLNFVPGSYMYGHLNFNNTNATAGLNERISIIHARDTIQFVARKNFTDPPFLCRLDSRNPLHAHAVSVANSVSSGSVLYVRQKPGSDECDYIAHTKSSVFLD